MTLRTQALDAARRVRPTLDEDHWRLGRWRAVRRGRRDLPVLRLGTLPRDRPTHLVVVPDHGPGTPSWQVAGGNLFYEVHRSAVEVLGEENVTLLAIEPGTSPGEWAARLVDVIVSTGATHVIGQVEADPGGDDGWSWDVVGSALARNWDGALIGVMYDSAYPWLRVRARRLGRLMPRLLIADLCVPMSGFVRAGRAEAGPMTMPFSQESIRAIDDYVRDLDKAYDVTFVGTLYEYRVELLQPLRDLGVNAVINPHRPDAPTDAESSVGRASYLDYMAALARSELTINFSLARGGPQEQYKIRVHEAALVGSLCVTDDRDRTRRFYGADAFATFTDVADLPRVVEECLADRDRLRERQEAARARAHVLSRSDFWGRIEQGLAARGLPTLTGLTPPAEP
jgi:hypothetical protein